MLWIPKEQPVKGITVLNIDDPTTSYLMLAFTLEGSPKNMMAKVEYRCSSDLDVIIDSMSKQLTGLLPDVDTELNKLRVHIQREVLVFRDEILSRMIH